jgi:adenylylsulfate kinase
MSGILVWFTGLPSSGKTTLANRVAGALAAAGRAHCVLDGDAVRAAMVPSPGYDPASRADFYATLARLAALLAGQGLIVLVPATAHRRVFREKARALAPRFVEVFVSTGIDVAMGLYHASRAGGLAGLPGAEVEYEAPEAPDVVARGDGEDQEALARLLEAIGEPQGRAQAR